MNGKTGRLRFRRSLPTWTSVLSWSNDHRPVVVLGILIGLYLAIFSFLTWRQHTYFGTAGFDMGIYDQGLWLLSRFREPFVTVRGLNYFGHHANYATIVLVPAYWLGAGPRFLYLFETAVLAAGAVPIWLLARERLKSEWLSVTLAASYLLHPAVGWINWWHFHPDALLITPLLYAYWFATRQCWKWFALCAGLVMLTKEDGALAMTAFGLVLLLRRLWKPGLATIVAGASWFLMTTRLLIPRANGGLHPLYDELFPAYGSSFVEIAGTMLLHPSRVIQDLTEQSRLWYFLQLVAPVAFAPLVAAPVLLIALPQLLVNSLSSHELTHDIHFHYSAIPVAAILLATVESFRRVTRRWTRRTMAALVLVASLAGQFLWGPMPLARTFDDGFWATPNARVRAMKFAVNEVPKGVGVSGTESFVPHLTHRPRIYVWPQPFEVVKDYWGVEGSVPPDPESVDYIIIDLAHPDTYEVYPQSAELFEFLISSGKFELVFDIHDIYVARRRHGL
jgi:uncharacterized membrane protein